MKIVRIFADRLSSFCYDSEEFDEMKRLFRLWQDAEFLENFFNENIQDLQSGFFGQITIERAITSTRDEAIRLEKELKKLSENMEESLDRVFAPLDHYSDDNFSRNKAKGDRQKSWLRIYALKIDNNLYAVTGGAIKLTRSMQEREHTNKELRKFERCRAYLKELGITDIEGFKELDL